MPSIIRELLGGGIATGDAVTLDVDQSGRTASRSTNPNGWGVAPPVSGGDAEVTITVERSSFKFAPEGIDFEVTGWSGFDTTGPGVGETFDARLHDLVYFWDFGDTGSVYTAPVNVPAAFLNRNVGYGWRVSHTYRTPGSPTISVLVVEPSSGKYAIASVTLNGTGDLAPIGNEDDYFPTTNTIWVDSTGDTTGMPAGATVRTDINGAVTFIQANSTTPKRVILRSGQTFDQGYVATGYDSASWGSTYWRSSSTAKAKIRYTHTVIGSQLAMFKMVRGAAGNTHTVRLNNIRLEGLNDLSIEYGPTDGFLIQSRPSTGTNFGPRYVQADRCDFVKASVPIYPLSDGDVSHIYNDCVFDENRDFGLFGLFPYISVTGCRFDQGTNSLNGGPKSNRRNYHSGGIRMQTTRKGVFDACDFFCKAGWSVAADSSDLVEQNSSFRYNFMSLPGSKLNLRRSVFEAGFSQLSLGNANSNTNTAPVNFVVGECILISGWSHNCAVAIDCGGVTVENCLSVVTRTGNAGTVRAHSGFVNISQIGSGATGLDARVMLRNNSYVLTTYDADYKGAPKPLAWIVDDNVPAKLTNIVQQNNVMHAPNRGSPVVASPALAKAAAFASPRTSGYRVSWTFHKYTLASSVAPGGSVVLPYPSGKTSADFGNQPWEIVSPFNCVEGETAGGGQSFSITMGASDFTLTNTGSVSWSAGTISLYLDHRDGGIIPPNNTLYATEAGAMALWHPVSAPGSAPSGVTLIDLLGRIRPGTLHPDAAPGTPSAGALEPA